MLVANDALEFLPAVDWVVVVVKVGHTTERSLRKMMQALRLTEPAVAGCVLVGALEASDAARYYYASYELDEGRDRSGEIDGRRPTPPTADQVLVDLREAERTASTPSTNS